MNLLEQLRALDINDIGRWPLALSRRFIVLIFAVATGGGLYQFVIKTQLDKSWRRCATGNHGCATALRGQAAPGRQLRCVQTAAGADAARVRHHAAPAAGQDRGSQPAHRYLPDGLAAGLEEKLFQPSQELQRDFYAELPIRIQLNGSYHEFGEFVSGIAALPRIVTLHNISIAPPVDAGSRRGSDSGSVHPNGRRQELDITAKTYRYLEDETESGRTVNQPFGHITP
jgi:type IV pilus assembly protein PilO